MEVSLSKNDWSAAHAAYHPGGTGDRAQLLIRELPTIDIAGRP
jgi:hypothetical protein